MIRAKKLSKKYGNLKVLNNVDLAVKEKEIVAITGPSGAGKQPFSTYWEHSILLIISQIQYWKSVGLISLR